MGFGKDGCRKEENLRSWAVHEPWARDGPIAAAEFFCADQNARLVNNAERYHRSVFHGCDEWCNPSYTHILDTAHFAPISTAAERKIVICVRISEMRARTQAADG